MSSGKNEVDNEVTLLYVEPMGTNIYTLGRKEHIGKRFAAGLWCWDCKEKMYVEDRKEQFGSRQLDECPRCGKRRDEKGDFNPAMRELGFDNKHHKPKGINGASGFIWQIGRTGLAPTVGGVVNIILRKKFLEDEYGRRITPHEFLKTFEFTITESTEDGEFS